MADDSKGEDPRGPEYGEANWVKQGKPFFGKIWTYEQIMKAERPAGPGRSRNMSHEHVETPANWPSDTKVDPGTWVYWLPEGWLQGIRTQPESGKTLKCYFTPEGKRFWHRKDIEKYLGHALEIKEPPPKDPAEPTKPRVRYVTDPDAIPNWPQEEWFPKDFKAAFRQLPSGLHPIYIPPGVEGQFLYHKHMVAPYLAGEEGWKLTDMDSTQTAVEKSAQAKNPGRKKQKREVLHFASETDYEPQQMSISVASGDEVTKIIDLLKLRGFSSHVEVLHLDGADEHPYMAALKGYYYSMAERHCGRPCYQKLRVLNVAVPRLVCSGVFLHWGEETRRWQVGTLQPQKGCIAFCDSDVSSPWQSSTPWMVLRKNFGREDTNSVSTGSDKPSASSQQPESQSRELSGTGQEPRLKKKTDVEKPKKVKPPAASSPSSSSKLPGHESVTTSKDSKKVPAPAVSQSLDKANVATAKGEEESLLSADGKKKEWDGISHTERVWTYEECTRATRRGDDLEAKPAHWPPDIEIMQGKWADWLPLDWGQGRKVAPNGNLVTKYVSPEGKVCHNKESVERVLGKTLTAETVPSWFPWLPKDWARSTRLQGGTPKSIFISPDRTRFLWTKPEVEKCIRDGKVNQCGGFIFIKDS